MDWTKFLQGNATSLFTLFGVFLGSLITFLISYLNTRFEAIERDKDRKEKRRESKTELAVEITKDDVKTMDNAIDNALQAMSIVADIRARTNIRNLSKVEMIAEIQATFIDENGKHREIFKLDAISKKLASALGVEVNSEYKRFDDLSAEYFDCVMDTSIKYEDFVQMEKEIDDRVIIQVNSD